MFEVLSFILSETMWRISVYTAVISNILESQFNCRKTNITSPKRHSPGIGYIFGVNVLLHVKTVFYPRQVQQSSIMITARYYITTFGDRPEEYRRTTLLNTLTTEMETRFGPMFQRTVRLLFLTASVYFAERFE